MTQNDNNNVHSTSDLFDSLVASQEIGSLEARQASTEPTALSGAARETIDGHSEPDDFIVLNPNEEFADEPIYTAVGLPYPNARGDEVDVLKKHAQINGQTAPILRDRATGKVCGRASQLQALNELGFEHITFQDVEDPFLARLADFNSGRMNMIEMSNLVVALASGKVEGFKAPNEGKLSEHISRWLKEHFHNGAGGISTRQVENYLLVGRASDAEREAVEECNVVSKAAGIIKKMRADGTPEKTLSAEKAIKLHVRKLRKATELFRELKGNVNFLKPAELDAFYSLTKVLEVAMQRIDGDVGPNQAA